MNASARQFATAVEGARPMRVLFVSHTLEPASGAASKVTSVATEWERQGHTVFLATTRDLLPRRIAEVAMRLRRPAAPRSFFTRARGEASFRALFPLELLRARDHLGLDAIYCRELPPAPGLRELLRRVPVLIEINGDVSRELGDSWKGRSRTRARGVQLGNAAGVVFVSRALHRACKPEPQRYIVLANPSLPSSVSVAEAPRPLRPTVVLIGYAKHPWAGMDKFVALARALPEFDFVVIGAALDGPSNLRCHPSLRQADADAVMSGCTVGVGPLGCHRRGIVEASPLKVRNYLALGLPVIQACEDTDLGDADSCVLQLPNVEDNVLPNVDAIRAFVQRAFEDRSLSEQAHALAHGRLSLRAKERTRLAFIERCVAEFGGGGH